jgi:hypothetical protein
MEPDLKYYKVELIIGSEVDLLEGDQQNVINAFEDYVRDWTQYSVEDSSIEEIPNTWRIDETP